MKRRPEEGREKMDASKSFHRRKKRLGGKGLSLEAFANAKSTRRDYNPALIKKQREFYKNAKYVSKFKKELKRLKETEAGPSRTPVLPQEAEGTANDRKGKKKNKNSLQSLREEYEKKREELEKARMEREALIQAKKEERERAESRRKELKQNMFKKTRSGQPIMKYRIEHLLQSIQGLAD